MSNSSAQVSDANNNNANENPLLAPIQAAQQENAQSIVNKNIQSNILPLIQSIMTGSMLNQNAMMYEGLKQIANSRLYKVCSFKPKRSGVQPCAKMAAPNSRYCSGHKYRCELEDSLEQETKKRKRAESELSKHRVDIDSDEDDTPLRKTKRTRTIEIGSASSANTAQITTAQTSPVRSPVTSLADKMNDMGVDNDESSLEENEKTDR
jgi:hypothetical protein